MNKDVKKTKTSREEGKRWIVKEGEGRREMDRKRGRGEEEDGS